MNHPLPPRYEDPKEVLGGLPQPVSQQSSEQQQPTSRPASTSAPAASQPRPAVTRPPPQPSLPTNWKLSSILVRGNQVGDYLKGLTETNATLSKEAVLVNDSNKVSIETQSPPNCKLSSQQQNKAHKLRDI